MFVNQKVEENQKLGDEEICFEPDSSPKAWGHYQQYYKQGVLEKSYDFSKTVFYNKYDKVGLKSGYKYGREWINYVNKPLNKKIKNRLFILKENTKMYEDESGNQYIEPAFRLGGECDFNFNQKKYVLFKEIIGNNKKLLEKLECCKDMHHTLLNFSLMQSMGNMQGFKGANRFDRLDFFVYQLDLYFKGISINVLSKSSKENVFYLKKYLETFKDIYDYCQEIYFISDKNFVDEIIRQGALPINTKEDVNRYMSLAQEFWTKKENYFLQKEFNCIGDYFKDGGETY